MFVQFSPYSSFVADSRVSRGRSPPSRLCGVSAPFFGLRLPVSRGRRWSPRASCLRRLFSACGVCMDSSKDIGQVGFASDDLDNNDDDVGMNSGLYAAALAGKSPRVPSRNSKVTEAGSGGWVPDASTKVSSDPAANIGGFSDTARVSHVHTDAITVSVAANIPTVTNVGSSRALDGGASVKGRGHAVASYASILGAAGSNKGNSLSFFPLKEKSDSLIEIPMELSKESSVTYQNTLYGYFLGPRLFFPSVDKEVKRLWSKFGFQEAMMNEHGFLFFRFSAVDGIRQVLEGGPWMIRGVPLFVFPWDPLQGLVKPEHKSCPLWVKLHNIPLVAFNREGVSRIASALGEPKMMDDHTTAMCDNAWGRPGFAKVLVDVWAVGDLKRELKVVIPNLNGGNGVTVIIRVEYLWEPSQCTHCKVFGHKVASCVNATVVKIARKDKGKEAQSVDDGGFIPVRNKKVKGVVFSEPKPVPKQPIVKQVYAPAKKPDAGTKVDMASGKNGDSSSRASVAHPVPPINNTSPLLAPDVDKGNSGNVPVSGAPAADPVGSEEPLPRLKAYLAVHGQSLPTSSNSFSVLDGLGETSEWDAIPEALGAENANLNSSQ